MAVSENLRTAFSMSDHFKVVERSYINQIIKEQEVQLSGLTKSEEAAQLGEIAGVDYIILGTLSKLKRLYIMNLRIVSVENGIIEKAASITVRSQKELISRTLDMSEIIFEEKDKKNTRNKKRNKLKKFKLKKPDFSKLKFTKISFPKFKLKKLEFRGADEINLSSLDLVEFSWHINKNIFGGDSELKLGLLSFEYRESFPIMNSDRYKYYYGIGLGVPVFMSSNIFDDEIESVELALPIIELGVERNFENYFTSINIQVLNCPFVVEDPYYPEDSCESVELRLDIEFGYKFE